MAIRLMLVEDDPTMQRMYQNIFSRAGFEVMTASDGTIVFETAAFNRPDIIIMDFKMPNFNGLFALKELKASPKTESIPVVMLSAYKDDTLVKSATQLGAAGYLQKGDMEPDELVAYITNLLPKTES